jgi:hypothetical protein
MKEQHPKQPRSQRILYLIPQTQNKVLSLPTVWLTIYWDPPVPLAPTVWPHRQAPRQNSVLGANVTPTGSCLLGTP